MHSSIGRVRFILGDSIMKKKGSLLRHRFIWRLLRPLVALFLRIKFGYKFKYAKKLPENYIVLANHTTDFDPLFVGVSFRRQMYFVASEHISRWKVAYKFLKYGFEPIIRYKGAIAASTVMDILRKVKRVGSVCIFAEGVRTWNGITSPILPSTAQLVKAAKCALVTYKIEGGYFVSPAWSEKGMRRGHIKGAPVNVYTKEQLASMSDDEVYELIKRDLYEDAYATQLASPKKYKGKQPAYRLENLIHICPECLSHGTLFSSKDTVECSSCGHKFVYNKYGMLEGTRCTTVKELEEWQRTEVAKDAENGAVYRSELGRVSAIGKGTEQLIAEGELTMSAESIKCGDFEMSLDSIPDIAIHGKHSLVFSGGDRYYEIRPVRDDNAMKFLLLFTQYKSIKRQEKESEVTS